MRTISIFGSTGSIGTQALDIAAAYSNEIKVNALTAHSNVEKLFEQVRTFRPLAAGITARATKIPKDLQFCQWYFGPDALNHMAMEVPSDDCLVAVVGMASLQCVLNARKVGKRVLLANKETLVAGGHLIMPVCDTEGDAPTLIPVDSEHSAIYQCLKGAQGNSFRRILLTASGGPFRTWNKNDIQKATVEQALCHPNWNMGRKITIDSATMFNKALEIIEAKWLFTAAPQQIQVLIHSQSIVHSMVEFEDGAVLAQLGTPDMHTPIMYAMLYPKRVEALNGRLDLTKSASLTFEEPDLDRFPSIGLAYEAMEAGNEAACVLNAANEEAVDAFLKGKIAFGHIFPTVRHTMDAVCAPATTVEEVLDADRRARLAARKYLDTLQ